MHDKSNAVCVVCGADFYARPNKIARGYGKYCTQACMATAFKERIGEASPLWRGGKSVWNRSGPPIGKRCAECGNAFSVYPYRRETATCCSARCARRERARREIAANPLPECVDCGKQLSHHGVQRCVKCSTLFRPRGIGIGVPHNYYAEKVRTGYRTQIEAMVEQHLIDQGIAYVHEATLAVYRAVDFYIPSAKLAVECDGVYWHSLPGAAKRDARKVVALNAAGYSVIRLSEKAIRDGSFKVLLAQARIAASSAAMYAGAERPVALGHPERLTWSNR